MIQDRLIAARVACWRAISDLVAALGDHVRCVTVRRHDGGADILIQVETDDDVREFAVETGIDAMEQSHRGSTWIAAEYVTGTTSVKVMGPHRPAQQEAA